MSGQGAEVDVPHDDNDPFVKKVAFSVAIFAVILALAGMGGKGAGKDMLTNQLDASNTWSRYQAKAQRDVMYTQELETLEQVHGALGEGELKQMAADYEAMYVKKTKAGPAENSQRQKLRLAYVTTKLAEYKGEKNELFNEATSYETERKVAHRKDGYFDYAELAMQLAIVLASISMLSKARWPYLCSLVLAFFGLLLTAGGYLIPQKYPDIHIPIVDPVHETGEKH